MFVSVTITFYSFALYAAKVPLVQCSRVSLLWRYSPSKPKVNFWRNNHVYHEARWFSQRCHWIVSLQDASFLRSCKGRGYRRDRRAGQTERKTSEFIVIWFKSISFRDDFHRENFFSLGASLPYEPFRSKEITDSSIINRYFVRIDFNTPHGSTTI